MTRCALCGDTPTRLFAVGGKPPQELCATHVRMTYEWSLNPDPGYTCDICNVKMGYPPAYGGDVSCPNCGQEYESPDGYYMNIKLSDEQLTLLREAKIKA